MIETKNAIEECSTDELISYAEILHYVTYERDHYLRSKDFDENEILKMVLEELVTRGTKLEWSGFSG